MGIALRLPLYATPPNEHKTRSVKAAPGYEDYASKGTSFTSSEDPSPEGSHDSTRLRPEKEWSREVNKTKDGPGFKNAGKMHKNKTKWRECFRHVEGRRWKEKKEKAQIQKKYLTKAVQILNYDNIFSKKVHN